MIYKKDYILDNKILMRYQIDEFGNKSVIEIKQGIDFKEAKKFNIPYEQPVLLQQKAIEEPKTEIVEPQQYQELFSKVLKDNEPKSKKRKK